MTEQQTAHDTEKAYRTLLVYQQYTGDESDTGEAIVRLIADLLHLADEYGAADEAQRDAWHLYAAQARS